MDKNSAVPDGKHLDVIRLLEEARPYLAERATTLHPTHNHLARLRHHATDEAARGLLRAHLLYCNPCYRVANRIG